MIYNTEEQGLIPRRSSENKVVKVRNKKLPEYGILLSAKKNIIIIWNYEKFVYLCAVENKNCLYVKTTKKLSQLKCTPVPVVSFRHTTATTWAGIFYKILKYNPHGFHLATLTKCRIKRAYEGTLNYLVRKMWVPC